MVAVAVICRDYRGGHLKPSVIQHWWTAYCVSLVNAFQFLQKQVILDVFSPDNKSGYYLIYRQEAKPSEAKGLVQDPASCYHPTPFIKRSRPGLSSEGTPVEMGHIPDGVPDWQGWGP